jgi:hypothetical protein
MAGRVHAAVEAMQASALEPVPDRPPAEAELQELRPADHAVLAVREGGDQPVDAAARVSFGPMTGSRAASTRMGTMVARGSRRER